MFLCVHLKRVSWSSTPLRFFGVDRKRVCVAVHTLASEVFPGAGKNLLTSLFMLDPEKGIRSRGHPLLGIKDARSP